MCHNRESFCNVQETEKVCNFSKFILLTKVQPHFSEDMFQLANTLENMGYSALGSCASQLGGEF